MSVTVGTVFRRTLAALTVFALLVAAGFLWVNRVEIRAYADAMSYVETPELNAIESKLDLTKRGSVLYRASHPTLTATSDFMKRCSGVDSSDGGHLLGCYTGSNQIHLFKVDEPTLEGIVEVTAAHELMHAAWARFPHSDRDLLIDRLFTFYEEYQKDHPEFVTRMDVYGSLGKASFANELHSVFATEVRELPDWLEEHYARWFRDREVVLDQFDNYHAVFESLQAEADSLQERMRTLRDEVEAASAHYHAAVEQFNRDVREFNARNDRYEFSDRPEEFAEISGRLHERRVALEAEHTTLNASVEEYERLRQELIELSEVSAGLERSLDSSLAPIDVSVIPE